MALSDRKIPIITGRNDTPTTSQTEANHPNGSFLISKYNALIDNELTALETNLSNLDIPSSSDDLTEGTTNKYFSGKTTDNLPEGTTNKYYSDNRTRLAISVTGNGSYDNVTGVINISNATISVDHISLTNTSGNVDTYTLWGDLAETITVGTFTVTNGVDGADGTNGTNGVDGAGIVATTVTDNLNGTHTVEFFTDIAKTQKVGEVILNDGVAGADGADGTNGVDGVSPTVTVLTQAQYNALSPSYDANTFYVING